MMATKHFMNPIRIFISYASQDKALCKELEMHLSGLQRTHFIKMFFQSSKEIHWGQEIEQHLYTTDINLLLISPDFMQSDYYSSFTEEIIKRSERNALTMPILLHQCVLQNTPLAHLDILPPNSVPIIFWKDRDEVWSDIAKYLRHIVKNLLINQWKDEADTFYRQENFEDALAMYDQILNLDFGNIAAHICKSNIYIGLHRYDEALKAYEQACEHRLRFERAWNDEGTPKYSQKKHEDALIVYQQVLQQTMPYSSVPKLSLEEVPPELPYHAVITHLDQAIQLDPLNPFLYHIKGNIYTQLQQYEKALGVYEQALHLRQDFTLAHIHFSETLENIGRQEYQKLYTLVQQANKEVNQMLAVSVPRAVPLHTAWTIPYPRNPFFIGRDELLSRLYIQFQASQNVALCGSGGVGKTQLAIEYVYRYYQEYEAVFWVRANSEETLISSYAVIATQLMLPEREVQELEITIQAVKTWLLTHHKWLLILDNIDDLDLLQSFLPTESRGHVLLTTHTCNMQRLITYLEVATMDRDVGALLLLRRAALITRNASLETALPSDVALAKVIAQELKGLPLALDLAGAYIEQTQCSLSVYQNLYLTRRAELLKTCGGLVDDSLEPVATTCSLSFQRVKETDTAAAELLRICAYLAPDAIFEEMISKGAEHLGSSLQTVAGDPFSLDQAIAALSAYSLICRNVTNKTLSIHRLVQAVLSDSMPAEETKQWKRRAVQVVNMSSPNVEDMKQWGSWEQWLPHALVCATWIEQEQMTDLEVVYLLDAAGYYLNDRARYREAEFLYRQAFEIRERQLADNHPGRTQRPNHLVRDKHEAQTWRDLLEIIISDAKERQRLIEALGVTSITLTRWVSGELDPRPQHLRHLLSVLPQHRDHFVELLKKERGFDEFVSPATEEVTSGEIPAEFYARIFVARATMSDSLRFWSTCNLILQQALRQLDPDQQGMSIWVVKCMPPSGPYNKVRSLREIVGQGTHPWSGNLEQQAMFLGAESLAGNVVTLCRPSIIENLDEEHNLMPTARVDFEKSAAIYPILYERRIAGVLLISSTQYNHFLLQTRTALAQSYADLITLSFEESDFYAPEDIALCTMPSHQEQKHYFAKFRRLIADTKIVAASNNRPVNNIEADQIVWQHLEEELLGSVRTGNTGTHQGSMEC